MKTVLSATFWISLYLLLVLAPLLILILGEVPPGAGFWWDFSMALGFSGMATMSVLFLLTARFQRACAPFGIDIIYYFHRYLAVLAVLMIFTHYLIIRIVNVDALGSLNPLEAPWHMTSGRVALMLLSLLIITSLWRKPLRIHYDQWRMLHIALAVTAFLLAMGHIQGINYYIEAPAKHWLWSGYSLIWVSLIFYIRLFKPWKMYHKPYRVTELRQERGDSWTLALEPEQPRRIAGRITGGMTCAMAFMPGQFAWLVLRASPWHVKEHPFSISSSAARQDRLEFTIKELGDFTRTVKEMQVGERAYLDGPYGIFSTDLHSDAAGFVFIAGGVGAAPIISMLRTLADRHDPRPLWFIYANNRWQDVIFREELELLKTRLQLTLVHVLTELPPELPPEPPTGPATGPATDWQGESGFITPQLLQKTLPPDAQKFEYFLCGPRPMSNAVHQGLKILQVPLNQIHFELFDLV